MTQPDSGPVDDFDDEPQNGQDGADKGPADPAAEADKWKALARKHEQAAKANAAAAKKLAQIEDANKTEQQRLEERATAAERRAAETESALLRMRVAVAKQLPSELVDRLRGSSEQELSADADALLALVQPGKPRGDVDQGVRGTPATADMNDLIRRAARR